MFSIRWLSPLGAFELLLGITSLILIVRSKSLRAYWPLIVISLWQLPEYFFLMWLRKYRVFSAQDAYSYYFYVYWSSFACAAVSSALLTYTIFHEVLRPLKGLQRLGVIMYRWIFLISVAVCLSVAFDPILPGTTQVKMIVVELQRLSGIVVFALLLFVILTIRPLGLSFRSRNFGVSLGLAIATTTNICTASFFTNTNFYNWVSTLITVVGCVAQAIWIWYLAVPEPTRKFVMLPTTSPFHQWNLVSERMGYDPGYVAIGGIPPQSYAPAELQIFQRIAEQNTRSATLSEGEYKEAQSLPLGSATATLAATERFARNWNL